jgi:hypothetical protein
MNIDEWWHDHYFNMMIYFNTASLFLFLGHSVTVEVTMAVRNKDKWFKTCRGAQSINM